MIRFLISRVTFFAIVLCFSLGCTTYFGVTETKDRLLITGNTSFLFFGSSWIKSCSLPDGKGEMVCAQLDESEGEWAATSESMQKAVEEQYSSIKRCIMATNERTAKVTILASVTPQGKITVISVSGDPSISEQASACVRTVVENSRHPQTAVGGSRITAALSLSFSARDRSRAGGISPGDKTGSQWDAFAPDQESDEDDEEEDEDEDEDE